MTIEDLRIEGMSCNHCVMRIQKELSKFSGIIAQEVRIGYVHVEYDETMTNRNDIVTAIERAGYQVALN